MVVEIPLLDADRELVREVPGRAPRPQRTRRRHHGLRHAQRQGAGLQDRMDAERQHDGQLLDQRRDRRDADHHAGGRNLDDALRSCRSPAPRPARRFGSRSTAAIRTARSPRYQFPFLIEASATLKVRAFKPGFAASAIVSATYALDAAGQTAMPLIVPGGGRFATTQAVHITGPAGSTLRYTTHGSRPDGH